MLAVITIYQISGMASASVEMRVALVALFLAVVLILILLSENRQRALEYEAAVAPLYEHHPSRIDAGIDVEEISPYQDPRGPAARQVFMRVDAMPGKVLFFICAGEIRAVHAWVQGEQLVRKLGTRILAPNMFEVHTEGASGGLSLLIHPDSVRLSVVEWRDAHRKRSGG